MNGLQLLIVIVLVLGSSWVLVSDLHVRKLPRRNWFLVCQNCTLVGVNWVQDQPGFVGLDIAWGLVLLGFVRWLICHHICCWHLIWLPEFTLSLPGIPCCRIDAKGEMSWPVQSLMSIECSDWSVAGTGFELHVAVVYI